jgi:hypothetical protein
MGTLRPVPGPISPILTRGCPRGYPYPPAPIGAQEQVIEEERGQERAYI